MITNATTSTRKGIFCIKSVDYARIVFDMDNFLWLDEKEAELTKADE